MEPTPEKFQTKKSLGQHFLNSPVVPGWMCDAANITSGEVVLEIGPGTGALTKELLARGAHVIALEADQRAIVELEKTFTLEMTSGHLQVIHADVRKFSVAQIPQLTDHSFKVVANIPYYLSGLLFRSFLESPLQPTTLVYLVQKEVAKRICVSRERGEKESLLSLSVKVYGTPEYVRTVTRGHFTPSPKVDSAIIAVRNINRDCFTKIDEALYFEILHLAFGQKRKQLVGNLAERFGRETIMHTLSTLGVPVSARAEDISPELWPTIVGTLLSTLKQ